MKWDDAMDAVAARSCAACGLDRDAEDGKFHPVVVKPADLARKMLSGYMSGSELDAAVGSLSVATENTLMTMALAMEDPRGGDPRYSLYMALTQMLLQGILVASGPVARGDGASQEPSDDFPGATQ